MADRPSVVITGLGVVTPLGCTKKAFWKNIQDGSDGIGPLTKLDASLYKRPRAAEVKTFSDCEEAHDPRFKKYGHAVLYAIAATRMAIEDSGYKGNAIHGPTGLFVGTAMGNQDIIERLINQYGLTKDRSDFPDDMGSKLDKVRPFYLASVVAKRFQLSGPMMVIPTACAAGNYALGTAVSMIRHGRCQIAIACGADPFSRTCFTIFDRLGANTPDVCKPFDPTRQGLAVGEGAAMLVLEDLDHAKARGARIYAQIKGYGLGCDAYHSTAPHPEGRGAVQSMRQALSQSHLLPKDIHYINAHGTGTKANDLSEAIAMATVFGDVLRNIPVSSIKSMLGHCMGAASAIESAVCALALHHQVLPPTINTQQLDPEFPISFDTVPKSRPCVIENIMSNAFAFGGNVSSLVMSRMGVLG